MIRYRDNMSEAESKALLAECEALDRRYAEAFADPPFHQLCTAAWLAAQWELAGPDFMAPREEWDTEANRRMFVEDYLINESDELRKAGLDHRGRP